MAQDPESIRTELRVGNIDFLPIGQAQRVPVDFLDFDENNPRFTPDK